MNRSLWPLALAATLLCPLAAHAQTPTVPVAPSAPAAPVPPAAPKKHSHIHGTITAVDAVARTVTVTTHHGPITLALTADAKIYKLHDIGGTPTGTFTDLSVGALIGAHLFGDESALTTNEIHIFVPHEPKPDAPTAP